MRRELLRLRHKLLRAEYVLAVERQAARRQLLHCDQCDHRYYLHAGLAQHVRKRHPPLLDPKTGRFVCPKVGCGKSSKYKGDLAKHQRLHRQGEAFVCNTCLARFVSFQHLEQHEATHKLARPYRCTRCSAAWPSVSRAPNAPMLRNTAFPKAG